MARNEPGEGRRNHHRTGVGISALTPCPSPAGGRGELSEQTLKCRFRPALAAFALVLVAGCGGGLELAPVSGVVTLDGQPVADAAVVFSPVAQGPAASGTTDAQGRFTLTTVNQPGAVPGEHQVTITKQTMHGITADGMPGPQGIRIEWHVPEKYSRPETSGLKATISPTESEYTFKLSSTE